MATPIMLGGKKIGRLRASFLLFKESWRFLAADKELVVIPVITAVLNLALVGLVFTVFIVSQGGWSALTVGDGADTAINLATYLFAFMIYVVGAFTLAVSQAAIVHTVYTRAHGGNATLGQSLQVAFSHTPSLLVWSLITSTVGMILQQISQRSKIIGAIVAFLLGTAWNVLTYFVIPAMVLDKKSAFAAIPHATTVFKRTWGETLVTNISLGLFFFVAYMLVLASFVGLMIAGISTNNVILTIVAIMFGVVWLIVASLVQAALQGVIKTLLYIYASEDVVPVNFNRELLEAILVRRNIVPVATTPASVPSAVVN